jgi:hypothetical protein
MMKRAAVVVFFAVVIGGVDARAAWPRPDLVAAASIRPPSPWMGATAGVMGLAYVVVRRDEHARRASGGSRTDSDDFDNGVGV